MRALCAWALLVAVSSATAATAEGQPAPRYATSNSVIERELAPIQGQRFYLNSRLVAGAAEPLPLGPGLQLRAKFAVAGSCVAVDEIYANGFEALP